jgi:hypothetical protein
MLPQSEAQHPQSLTHYCVRLPVQSNRSSDML